MNKSRRSLSAAMALATIGQGWPSLVKAQDYPSKPIKIISPAPPGGGTDYFARLLGNKLSENLKVPVIVDNRVGGSGIVAVAAFKAASPDGYSLLQVTEGTAAANPNLHDKLPYDTEKDFSYIVLTVRYAFALVTSPSLPVKTVSDLVALMKARPGEIKYGSAGNPTPHRIAFEQFNLLNGLKGIHVPYKGSAPAIPDLLGDRIDAMFLEMATAGPLIQSGRIKALGMLHNERLPDFPGIATFAELGLPDLDAASWQALAAPTGTPPNAIQFLNREVNRVLRDPQIRKALAERGMAPMGGTPEQAADYARVQRERAGKVIRAAGITM